MLSEILYFRPQLHASTVEKGIQLFSKSVKSLLKLEFISVIGVVTF